MTTVAAVIALITSLLALVLLARRDPKRLRSLAQCSATPHTLRARQVLAALALLPGMGLAVLGDWPAFLIWLGGLTAMGWLLVQWLSARH